MQKVSLINKAPQFLLFVATAFLAFGRMGVLNASVFQPVESRGISVSKLIAFDNSCADDELLAGDEVTVEGEDYALEEDADGLFIAIADETYSVVSFESDCETVSFQQVDGVDVLSGNDVDDEESEEEELADEDLDEDEMDEEEEFADEDLDEDEMDEEEEELADAEA
jgi:hypothetical protein